MRLGITHNNFLSYLGIIGVTLFIVFTMKLIPSLKSTPAESTAAVSALDSAGVLFKLGISFIVKTINKVTPMMPK